MPPQNKYIPTETNPERRPIISKEQLIKIGKTALALLGIFVVVESFASIVDSNHGVKDPNQVGHIDTKIADVMLYDGARIRFDPNTGSSDNLNIVEELKTDQPVKVETPAGAYVTDDDRSPNGVYYGVKVEDIKKVDPDFNAHGDNDGVVWINQQKATAEETTKEN